MIYAPLVDTWKTPAGHPVEFAYREGTNDWNTISSTMAPHDEYRIPTGLTGWALDIGAYLGSVAIGLALDNPSLRVLAVEPVPDNARLIRTNLIRNGLADRVTVLEAAAGGPEDDTTVIRYGYRGEPNLEHHAFVGNTTLVYEHGGEAEHDEREVTCYSLTQLLGLTGALRFAFAKVDCEGCEWGFLTDPAIARIDVIAGEWHNVLGHAQGDLVNLLGPTHDVIFDGPEGGPGGFRAVLR